MWSLLLPIAAAALALGLLTQCHDDHPSAPIRTAPLLAPTPTQALPNPSATQPWHPQQPQPPEQVPGPLGALGALSAWASSRRLRRRIREGR